LSQRVLKEKKKKLYWEIKVSNDVLRMAWTNMGRAEIQEGSLEKDEPTRADCCALKFGTGKFAIGAPIDGCTMPI
jgi:hypothetical protein